MKTKSYTIIFSVFLLLFILGGIAPQMIYAEESDVGNYSTELESITIGMVSQKGMNYNTFNNYYISPTMKTSYFHPQLLDEEHNIYYSDIEKNTKAYLLISGERKSSTATISVKDLSDPNNLNESNFGIDYTIGYTGTGVGKNVAQTDFPQNPFITKGAGLTTDPGGQNINGFLKTHYGMSCYEITVTDNNVSEIYYLILNDKGNGLVAKKDGTAPESNDLKVDYKEITFYDGMTKQKFADTSQYVKDNSYGGISSTNIITDDTKSMRLSLKRDPVTTTYPYAEASGYLTEFYRQDSNYVSINGQAWSRVDGDGEGLSQELVLKQGLNILQIRSRSDGEVRPTTGLAATVNYSTRVILLYREGESTYTVTPGEDVSLKASGIQLLRAVKPGIRPTKDTFKEYPVYEENGKNYLDLKTSEQYLLIKVPTVDANAIVGVNGATSKVGGTYLLPLDPDVYNEETPVSVSITPANGDESKEVQRDYYIRWTPGGANMAGVTLTNATLNQDFKSDSYPYIVTPTGGDVTFSFSLAEGAAISSITKDWTEVAKSAYPNNTLTVGADTQELKVTVDATSDGVAYSNVYYFEFPLKQEGASGETKQQAKDLLDTYIERFEQAKGDQLTSAYWETFAYAGAGGDLNGKYVYNVATHPSESATAYGAIVLQLVLCGENPYDYHGVNYIERLLSHQTKDGGFGPWGSNIWALMALDAAGAQYDNQEALINTVASQGASSSFDLDMRGWALIASASHSNTPGVEAKIASAVRDIKNYQETKNTTYNGAFQNPFYTNYNIATHSCVVSGLAATGLDIGKGIWKVGDKSALSYLLEYPQIQNDDGLNTQYIIALADVYNGSNVWQRAVLKRTDFNHLVSQAETALATADAGLKKDNLSEKLAVANAAAQGVGTDVVTGLGPSYYALKQALDLVDPTVIPDVTIGSDQIQADYVMGLITAGTTVETKKTAKLAYYALNDTQKNMVTNRSMIMDDSDIAGEITVMINALPSLESITIDHKTAVSGVRSAYDLLTESQKSLISPETLKKLTDSEAKIKTFEGGGQISADQQAANAVIEKINALGSISSYSQKETVDAARAAYTALTNYRRTLVTNLNKLEVAEAAIIALTPEYTITVAIERFTIGQGFYIEPQTLTIKQGDTAWDAVEKLLGAENMVVGNDPGYLAAIKGADTGVVSIPKYIIDELKAGDTNAAIKHGKTQSGNTLGEKDYSDQSGWMYFVNNNAPGVGMKGSTLKNGDVLRLAFTYWGTGADVTGSGTDGNGITHKMSFIPESRDNLLKALAKVNGNAAYLNDSAIKEAYETAMTVVQDMTAKTKPINEATTALNKAIVDYKPGNPTNPGDDAKIAKVVTDQIAALPAVEKLALKDKDVVAAARSAYDALTEAQKILVANQKTLTAAEAKITVLQTAADTVAAKAVTDKIAALPTVATLVLTDKDAVAAARAAYDALSEGQKKLVTNLSTLTAAEAQMVKLLAGEATEADKAAAKVISDQIAGLPSGDKLTLGSMADVVAARTAYNKLTDIQKALVANTEALAAAEAKIAELEKATPPAKDKDTGIEMVGLPEGVGLKVEPETGDAGKVTEAEKAAVEAGIKDAKVVSLYSIKPDMSEADLAKFNSDPDSFVTLTMPLGEDQQGYDNYKIYHKKTDGTVEWITPTLSADGKSLIFKVNAFSEFGVVGSKTAAIPTVDFSYRTHVQNEGWQDWKNNGAMSGTQGQSLRLEGIEIKRTDTTDVDLGIRYETHIENLGWEDSWKIGGKMSGTEGQSLRLEAIRIELTGVDAKNYDVYYQVHAQNTGWMAFAKNGEDAGTAGFGYRLEGIHVVVVPKGQTAPILETGSIDTAFLVKN